MKVYKVELLIIDFDKLGPDEIKSEIENCNYLNDCISPKVKAIEERDIGEWSDDNPLNNRNTSDAEYKRLFGK
jgi:hypothetical protein